MPPYRILACRTRWQPMALTCRPCGWSSSTTRVTSNAEPTSISGDPCPLIGATAFCADGWLGEGRGCQVDHESRRCENRRVAPNEIDRYLAGLDQPQRSTLEALRKSIMEVVPDAEQCISYGTPAFKLQGKTVAGFAAFQNHLSYLPHGGSVLATLPDDVAPYETSKGSLKFAINKPLPKRLVKKLVHARMQELGWE
jgi:uncharacterized protein YdhG (YjbR/CyaY superfamily)